MALSILKEISCMEEMAEQIEAQAQQKSRETVAASKKDAAAILEQAVEKAESEAKMMIKDAEDKAIKDISDIDTKIKAQSIEIKEKSGTKLKDAVDFIVGRIEKLSDR